MCSSDLYSLYAPAGTPKPILLALSRAVGEFMASPKMSQKLISEGSHPPDGAMTPDEFRAYTLREYAEVERQVKNLDVKIY